MRRFGTTRGPLLALVCRYDALAYAVTVHKLQGLTLDWLVIHCAHIRRFGQFYTALSRVRSLDRVRVEGFVRTQAIKADPRALAFYADDLRQAAAAAGGGVGEAV